MNEGRVRVLVVDDSAFARKVLRECLTSHSDIEVVGIAHDGLDALEKIVELAPDVVTLDLVMPHLDGLGVLAALEGKASPRVVVVSSVDDSSERVLAALDAGAVDFVHKPTALATDRLFEINRELGSKVRAAARAAVPAGTTPRRALPHPASGQRVQKPSGRDLVVLGTSTGGPQALTRLIPSLPEDFAAPLALVLHIPVGYTEAIAKRLNGVSALEVLEAEEGMELVAGRVVVARAGWHLRVERVGEGCVARLGQRPTDAMHRPSVDVLFSSAAKAWGSHVIAVVLTGMGNDGLAGAREIRDAGGQVLTEDASSCVIYGMPRCVDEAGLSNGQVPLEDMAGRLAALTRLRAEAPKLPWVMQ